MREFSAISFNEKEIVLKNSSDIGELYKAFTTEDAILLKWHEGGQKHGEMLITSKYNAKVLSGELTIKSAEVNTDAN